ncbi:MAG: zinc-ribbon domain-containing protein [Thermodesulfovibrionales bacterium]|nr:zinc-ribbon domain-containing protein [Thermodesulfovibrionales bacterium]
MIIDCPNCKRRLRLDAEKILSKQNVRIKCPVCKQAFTYEFEEDKYYSQPLKKIVNIPSLPEPIKNKNNDHCKSEEDETADSETGELIDKISGSKKSSDNQTTSAISTSQNILEAVQRELLNNNIDVENRAYELIITLPSLHSFRCMQIRHDRQKNEIIVKSHFLLVKSAIVNILKKLSQQECFGTFYIENYKNEECFSLKYAMSIKKYDVSEIIERIIEIYLCSKDISEIIGIYYDQ